MAALLARYRVWRRRMDESGDGPVIWWPLGGRAKDSSSDWSVKLYLTPARWTVGVQWEREDWGSGRGTDSALTFSVPMLSLAVCWWRAS